MTLLNSNIIEPVLNLLQQNKKVDAVKYVVEHSSLGLKEAKDWVELLMDDPQQALQVTQDFENTNYSHKAESSTSIRIDHDKQKVYLIDSNGNKTEIDEFHPQWQQAMQNFGRGTIYSNKHDFISAMDKNMQEIKNLMPTLDENHPDHSFQFSTKESKYSFSAPTHSLQEHDSVAPSQVVGIEDLSQNKNAWLKWGVLGIVFILILVYLSMKS